MADCCLNLPTCRGVAGQLGSRRLVSCFGSDGCIFHALGLPRHSSQATRAEYEDYSVIPRWMVVPSHSRRLLHCSDPVYRLAPGTGSLLGPVGWNHHYLPQLCSDSLSISNRRTDQLGAAQMKRTGFDDVIHAPNRLHICASLSSMAKVEFGTLRELLGVSDSVLSKHLKVLEEAGYVDVIKRTEKGRQRTWLSLNGNGRKAFQSHVRELRKIVG